MATLNYTHEEESKTFDLPQSVCSAEIAKQIHGPLILFSVLNTLLSTTAFLGNALILICSSQEIFATRAIQTTVSHPGHNRSMCWNHIGASVCYGLGINDNRAMEYLLIDAGFLISYTLGSVSMMTISTISVDRLLALSLRLRYKQIVTLKRTYAVVIAIWLTGIGGTAISLWNYFLTLWIGYIGVFVCLIVSCFSYIRIFLTLRQNQMLIRPYDHQNQARERY